MIIRNKKSHNRGFTLIEMLIAVFIFTVSMSALTLMAGRGIRAANDSQDRIVGEFLGVEAVEVVRNIRDSAFLSGLSETSWTGVFGGTDVFGSDPCFNFEGDTNQNKTCEFHYDSSGAPTLRDCSNCFVYLGSEGYENDAGTPGGALTIFTRKIYLNQVSENEIKVRVTVEWRNDMVEFQDTLFLWG